MIATFKETVKSVTDLSYGKVIVGRSLKSAFWYWYKYVLLFAAIIFFVVLAGTVYFTPQLSKIAEDRLPVFDLTVKDGVASTHLKQPQMYTDSNMAVILNLAGKPTDLDNYPNGALVLADKILVKTTDNNVVKTQEMKWSDMGNFSVTKDTIVTWLTTNKAKILGVLLGGTLLLGLIILGFYTLGQMIGVVIWSLLFLIVAKIMKKKVEFTQVMNLVLYVSVIPLLIGVLHLFWASQILSVISLGLFIFYPCAWIYKLK